MGKKRKKQEDEEIKNADILLNKQSSEHTFQMLEYLDKVYIRLFRFSLVFKKEIQFTCNLS